MSPEKHLSPEIIHTPPDLLIVLGKNIGINSTPQDMRDNKLHLSVESRLNVIAAGELYSPGMHILFSGGHTAGPDTPSEAAAMSEYFKTLFPSIPEDDVLQEDQSLDTAGNAEMTKRMITNANYNNIGLLSVNLHARNATKIFRRVGVDVQQTFATEEIVSERSEHHAAFIVAWQGLRRVRMERQKERVRTLLLHTVDPKGQLLGKIAGQFRG